ncbi:LacI family DNA-binding transcriptional regulator [Aquabacterium sp. OR-4]|uniref:LacI family DNA-binding transcriptional regulator n=1 Tax=Aquabacterium sp. OR-4 TaxID=2978127 RepID=UPI0028CAC056|nr:LacI family DNA-binding transcriptional regulator [Aquabacterium sp. OR-4]MDT7838574.1 LacI family DNA-binding transcriptional regulator [Aquabacterium sp. OR-4]
MSDDHAKLTIREVAEAAGVSRMTVTRVMRQDPLVAPKTRAAVEAVIKRLGYEPMHAARNLSSSKPRVIGVVSQQSAATEAMGLGNEYLNILHLGALQVCNEANYGLIFFPALAEEGIDTYVRRVKTRQVAGYVLAAPSTETPGLVEALLASDIPFSAINPADPARCPLSVLSNDRLAVRQIVDEMLRQGHCRIAFAGAGSHVRASSERLAGYLDAISGAAEPRQEPIVYETRGIAFGDGLALGRRIFGQADRPTAIQCITDDMAAGVIAAAHERRLLMPEVLSVGGFDNFGLAMRLYPALSTATLPLMDMAIAATRQVRDTLDGREVAAQICIDCPVVLRDSIGPGAPVKRRARQPV